MGQMRLTVTHTGKGYAMECQTPEGVTMTFDNPDEGTHGASPMQHVLAAAGACALMDVDVILRKKRLDFSNLRVECAADRPDGVTPKPFLAMRLRFLVDGDVPAKAFDDAVRLSVEKYCSAITTLQKATPVTYEAKVG